jgi:hypothetical protein
MGDEDDRVRGMGEAEKQAAAGMALFGGEETVEFDKDAAQKFKDETDEQIKALQAEAAALTGKDNKKMRDAKNKEASGLKVTEKYIDALKVIKELKPPNGNFAKVKAGAPAAAAPAKAAEAAAEPEKDDKKKADKADKKDKKESAGISRAEKDELEKLKNDIIERKKALKEQGMSGGQMNKDEQIVGWVNRMNELKEKENPGALKAAKEEKKGGKKKKLDSESMAMLEQKQKELAEYEEKLRTEFKYSKKDIQNDPDYKDMKKEIDALNK